jgi:hypothetical protein
MALVIVEIRNTRSMAWDGIIKAEPAAGATGVSSLNE